MVGVAVVAIGSLAAGIGWMEASSASAPPVRKGIPASGSELDLGAFSTQLPPAPLDALEYEVRSPLFNTEDLIKRRWVWVPDGKRIELTVGSDGQVDFDVPVGTVWFKEFGYEAQGGDGETLIERRAVVRVDPSVDPSGWKYYAAHTEPTELDPPSESSRTESGDAGVVELDGSDTGRMLYEHDDWLPSQPRTSAVQIGLASGTDYVFPGMDNCVACHGGASGAYGDAQEFPARSFGLHPRNMTAASLAAMERRGWLVGADLVFTPEELRTEIDPARRAAAADPRLSEPPRSTSFDSSPRHDAADPTALTSDELTADLVAQLRNNCASCHNEGADSPGASTAFRLDPNVLYDTRGLADALAVEATMMGDLSLPLVTPGDPTRSELVLRATGSDGRRRMPPYQGGVPHRNDKLVALLSEWITRLDMEVGG